MTKCIRDLWARKRVSYDTGRQSEVQQHAKIECDVNYIVGKYARGEAVEHVNSLPGVYGDFTNVPDYKAAIESVYAAEAAFSELPATVRKRFGNDPAAFIEFCSDEKNRDEAIRLGLVEAPKLPTGSPNREGGSTLPASSPPVDNEPAKS